MPTVTITLPDVGADLNAWGDELNTILQSIATAINNLTPAQVGLANVPNVNLQNRNSTSYQGQQPSSTISDFAEAVQDLMGATLVAGAGIAIGYDDVHNTVTISQTGAYPVVEIYWDGTGTCPFRNTAAVDPSQPVNWKSPIASVIPIGTNWALEQDSWDAE